MRILIISVPRSGSTSLMKILSDKNKLTPVLEPFSYRNPKENILSNEYIRNIVYDDNIVLKTLIGQDDKVEKSINWDYCKNFLINLSKTFNETILLSRKDTKAQIESHAYACYSESSWINSYDWIETPNYDVSKNYIDKSNNLLNEISKELKIPITWYEDIFDLNSPDRLRNKKVTSEKKYLH